MKKIIFLLLSIFSLKVLFAQSGSARITFQVLTPNGSDSLHVYIVGNNIKLGNWNPGQVALTRINNFQFTGEFDFKVGESLEFKFTKGKWDAEALDSNNSVPQNNVLIIRNDTTVIFIIHKWKDEAELLQEFKGQITGEVRCHSNLTWHGLELRDVTVWLPPEYATDTSKRYPVLYMHDGQNIFDPKTSAFGIDWQIDEAADSLIKQGVIQPIIVVGIYNSYKRSREYLPNDTSKIYMDFVVNKVKPLIDSLYRTKPDRENTATGGSSAGGTISFMSGWERPDIFSKVLCMSPAFTVVNESYSFDYTETVAAYAGMKKKLKIYIDNGGIGLETELQPGIDKMITGLKLKNFIMGEDLFYLKSGNDSHSESAWAKRIPAALKILFPRE